MIFNLLLSLEGFECWGSQTSQHFSGNLTMLQNTSEYCIDRLLVNGLQPKSELLVLCWTLRELGLHITQSRNFFKINLREYVILTEIWHIALSAATLNCILTHSLTSSYHSLAWCVARHPKLPLISVTSHPRGGHWFHKRKALGIIICGIWWQGSILFISYSARRVGCEWVTEQQPPHRVFSNDK